MSSANLTEIRFSQNRHGDPQALYLFDNGYGVSSVLQNQGWSDERLSVAIFETGPSGEFLFRHPAYRSFADESGSVDVLWTDGVLQIYGDERGQLFAKFLQKVGRMSRPVRKNAGRGARRRRTSRR